MKKVSCIKSLAVTGNLMLLLDLVSFPLDSIRVVLDTFNSNWLTPIAFKAGQNVMLAKLLLSISDLYIVKFVMSKVMTKASSYEKCADLASFV